MHQFWQIAISFWLLPSLKAGVDNASGSTLRVGLTT